MTTETPRRWLAAHVQRLIKSLGFATVTKHLGKWSRQPGMRHHIRPRGSGRSPTAELVLHHRIQRMAGWIGWIGVGIGILLFAFLFVPLFWHYP